jgi:hypothetical protein
MLSLVKIVECIVSGKGLTYENGWFFLGGGGCGGGGGGSGAAVPGSKYIILIKKTIVCTQRFLKY